MRNLLVLLVLSASFLACGGEASGTPTVPTSNSLADAGAAAPEAPAAADAAAPAVPAKK
jgi:hypothetical protein